MKKLFIFQHHDGKVSVRDDVVVTHLTSVSNHWVSCMGLGVCVFFFFTDNRNKKYTVYIMSNELLVHNVGRVFFSFIISDEICKSIRSM